MPLSVDVLANLKSVTSNLIPPQFQQPTATRKVTGTQMVAGKSCYVLESRTGDKSDWSFFEVESGLLVKARTENETRLGTAVTEVTFEDYRDSNGIKLPYSITFHYMTDQVSYQVSDLQTNIEIAADKLDPPAPKERKTITLAAGIMDGYVGEYKDPNGATLTISRDGDKLFLIPAANGMKFQLLAETETEFSIKDVPVRLTFIKNASGQVTNMIVHQGTVEQKFDKAK
jgi:hypothetical protein